MEDQTFDEELLYLQERINPYHLKQRLGIEEHREGWVIGQGINLFHIENWYSIHSVIRGTLRLLGMRKRGRRNALDIRLNRQAIRLKSLPDKFEGYTLLLISDLHLDMNPDMPAALIEAVKDLDYDICVLTGDYRAKTWGSHLPTMAAMAKVRPHLKNEVYAILGNHDSIRMVPHFEKMDIRMLINESVALERDGERIYLAGIDDPHYYRSDNMELACDAIPHDALSILLSHSPEMYKQAAFAKFELMLCGHTHGGQVCLPGGVPFMVNANCPRRYTKGLWQFSALQGYTSVGSGVSVVDVRINCPPEVTLIELLPADPEQEVED
ncbi:MAG: metallophosphoesterase family protein [Gammaproteobacteria bacterium]|nr:metallophosphoesterase family protein [Gammaproteobacteria bacterium]